MVSFDVPRLDAAQRRQLWWFAFVALALLAAGIGLRDPWPSDEPRFTLAAQQMVESGDWMFPRRGIELYSDKPPMLMWMEAASYQIVRNWRIAFLLPSLLAALATLGLTYDLGRRLWNHRAGLCAAIGVLFAFQFMYQMKRAQIDPLVTAWITLANWGLLLHFLRGPNWRAYWLGCFAAGLGVITKGVGIIALLMFAPYLFARWRGWPDVLRTRGDAWRWLGGPLALLVAIALWLAPMLLAAHARGGAEYAAYVDDILFRQTAQRYANSWAHQQPVWYFLPVLLFNWFPLSLLYAGALPRWWRDLRAREARVMLPLAWTALIVVFFSIPLGKRDVYVLPALPMVALAMAPHFDELLRARWLRLTAFACAAIGGALLLAAGAWAMLRHPPAAQAFVERRDLQGLETTLWSMLIAIGAALLAAAAWFRPRRGVQALLAGLAAMWLVWSLWAYPLLNDSSSAAGIMRRARQMAGANDEIGLVAWREQNLLMALGPTRNFGFRKPRQAQYVEAVAWLAQAPRQRWLFVREDAMGACVDRDKARFVGTANRRRWWLLRGDAVVAGCVPAAEDAAGEAADDEP